MQQSHPSRREASADHRGRRAREAQNLGRSPATTLEAIRGLEHDPTYPTPYTYAELWARAEMFAAEVQRRAAEQQAYNMGRDAALAAASWVIDGNTKPEAIAYVVALLDAGDPAADDYLPARPDLSGEYADEPTPQSLAADILGADWQTHGYNAPDFLPAEQVDALADAFERGAADHFEPECERILRAALEDKS